LDAPVCGLLILTEAHPVQAGLVGEDQHFLLAEHEHGAGKMQG
jgi:hypothetical protein